MFDIIASARCRNIDEVANNFAEALLFKNQKAKFIKEMQKVTKHICLQVEQKDSASMNSVVSQTNEDDQESAELSHTISNELDDDMRIQIAQELKSKI